MSSLVVLLPLQPATAQTEFGYVLTPDGHAEGAHSRSPAALLPLPSGAGAEVVAVAPASAISWHQVDLPKGTGAGSPRLRAVLEGLLEDRLLDEPETLHFALQPQARPGVPVWVAACNRAWLRSAVQVLEAAQRPATRIVPEFTPGGEPMLYALGDPHDAQLVSAGAAGVMALPLASSALSLLPATPAESACLAEPAVAALAEQVLQQKVQLQQAPQRWLQAARSPWDLAQADFASSGRARTMKRLAGGWAGMLRAPQWRPARWGAVLLVAVNLVGLNAWAWKERSALAERRNAIAQTLTRTFPQVKVVVEPVVQMEKEVALLRQATGGTSGNDMEAMLVALAAAAPQQPVAGLEFSSAGLRVRGVAADPGIAQRLKAMGYSAQAQGDALLITPAVLP